MHIAVLLSGGVDSSVALHLLKQEGHDVTAFYLKIWLEDELSHLGSCPWEEDLSFARAVCEQLNVPLRIVPLQREYHDRVVTHIINEIKAGRTPNPDIMCNQLIKFGAFEEAAGKDFEKIATGHYAQVVYENGFYHLYRSPDERKDQTYFLALLSQQQLSRALFPIGAMRKEEVRDYARRHNLPTQARKDSQGICFLGKIAFSDFIKHHVGVRQGVLREYETGLDLGAHEGFWYYTIGQRHSIGLSGGPWYVVSKDTDRNIVYISKSYYTPDKKRDFVRVNFFNWIGEAPQLPGNFLIKLRHGEKMCRGTMTPLESQVESATPAASQQIYPEKTGRYEIMLDNNDQGIASRQYAVVYQDTHCLGGGIIE